MSGVVVRRVPTGVVINLGVAPISPSGDREIEVDLTSVIDVWKETSVPPSAIEVSDDLMINGTQGANRFVARYAWVNIGRRDGVKPTEREGGAARPLKSGGGSDPLRTRYAARRTRSVPVSLSTSRSVRVEAERKTGLEPATLTLAR